MLTSKIVIKNEIVTGLEMDNLDRAICRARIRAVMEVEHVDERTAMFMGNGRGGQDSVDPVAIDQSIQLVKAMGLLTGEEAIRVMGHISPMQTKVKIEGAQREPACPARRRLDTGREGAPGR